MWLASISVVLLVVFSCVLIGVWMYSRGLYDARQKELAEIRAHKAEVKRQRKEQQRTAAMPSRDGVVAASADLQRRHRSNIDVRGLEASPLLGNASPTRTDEEESTLLR